MNELSDADVMTPEPAKPREFSDAEVSMPPPPNLSDPATRDAVERSYVGRVWDAFRSGFNEGAGPEPLGWSPEHLKQLRDWGLIRSGDETGPLAVARAADEVLFYRGAQVLDAATRSPTALYRGLQSAGVAAGLSGDVVSIPDAFMGSPLHVTNPEVKPAPIRPVEIDGEPIGPLSRVKAAQTGISEVDAVLNSPVTRNTIENAVIDRSHTVPYMAGGSTPLEDPTVYVDKHVPKEQTVPSSSDPGQSVKFDPAVPWAIHENVEQHVMDLLIQGGMKPEEAYRVAHFKFAEPAEQAWYRAHDIDEAAAEREQQTWLPRIQHENADDIPTNLYKKPYPHDDVGAARHESVHETPPSDEEVARAFDIIDRAQSGIVAYHGSPHSFEVFDVSKIGTGEGAQSFGHGLYFAETPGVAETYKGTATRGLSDVEMTANSALRGRTQEQALDFLTRSAARVPGDSMERVYNQAADLIRSGWSRGNLYRVRINADPEHFVDYDKPLSDQDPRIREGFQAAIDELAKEPWYPPAKREEVYDLSKPAGQIIDAMGMEARARDKPTVLSDALRSRGIPGIKYLDQGSRAAGEGTRNYVVFDPSLIQITHRNGEDMLAQARDLGVIGPGRTNDISRGTPEQAANGAVPPQQPPPPAGGPSGEPPSEPLNPWQQRFEQFVSKLKAPDDVKQLIREAAKDNGDFLPARQGDIPLSHVEDIARAAGLEPSEVDPRGLGRLLKNDAEVRTAMQLMLQVTDNVTEAARAARFDGSPENLIALQESLMRRDIAVEQVVGLRAEWGRTGKVFQEFLEQVKDQQALNQFLKDHGRDADGLRKIAEGVATLNDRESQARFLHDMRNPSLWDKYLFYWVNALISGPITHAKYIGANAAFAGYEAGIVTPIAGAIGTARRLVSGEREGVYTGETVARLWGLLAGTPDALRAAWTAARNNIQVPLPGEVAKGINPVINMRPNPIGGIAGTVIGIPSRGASGIHSFFNFLGYRAELEAQAYRQAAKEGLSPVSDAFWQRHYQLMDRPTDAMMSKAIENGYHLTFISEPGRLGRALQAFTNAVPPAKLILPFVHIPGQIMRAAIEQTPAAFLDERMRGDLLGKNGAAAQDTQIARIVAGGAVSAMVVNWALNDNVTGYGPTDPTERALWLRTHEPYSVRLGGWWVSYNRFGPIGDLVGMIANLVDIGPKVKEGEYSQAAGQVIKATSRLLEDEVGMQGLVDLIEAMDDPDKKMGQFVARQAASNLPYSSLQRQTASLMDPYQREAKTFIDQLRYTVPYARQELLPKRDWLGEPVANPGYRTILRERPATADPIDLEVQRLQIKPGPPEARIGGVKLTPGLYDQYQATAGALTRMTLNSMIGQPGWYQLPDYIRETAIRHGIESSRKMGEATMQMQHPELIMMGVQQRLDHITGATHTNRPKNPPAGLQ